MQNISKISSLVGVGAAALIASPLLGQSAWGAVCSTGPLSTYTAPSFSCNVDGVTFSNITINTNSIFGSGFLNLATISPYSVDGEFGLQLNFFASAGTSTAGTNTGAVDFNWNFDATG